MSDILDFLRSLRTGGYDGNLPAGAPPRQPTQASIPMTKGDIESAARERALARKQEEIAARTADDLHFGALDDTGRVLAGASSGTPANISIMAPVRRALEWPGQALDRNIERKRVENRIGAGPYEDTELRRGVPPALGATVKNNPTPAGSPRETPEDAGKRAGMTWHDWVPPSNADEASALRRMKDASERGVILSVPLERSQGALTADPWEFAMGESAAQNAALTAAGGALGQPDGGMMRTSAPRKGLREQYEEAIAKIQKEGKGELSQEQKGWLLIDLGTRMMARSSKPGATLISAAGESGAEVSGRAQDQIEKNRTREKESRREALDSALRAINFEKADRDDIRADRKEDREEKRYGAQDERERQRIDLLRQQVDQGKKQIKESEDGFVLIDTTGKNPPALIKDPATGKPFKPTDKSNPNIEFYKWLMEDPKRSQFFLQGRGKDADTNSEETFEKALQKFAADVHKDPMIQPKDRAARIKDYGDFLRSQRGATPAAGGAPTFNTPAELQEAIRSGKVKKGDRVMTPEGERVVR